MERLRVVNLGLPKSGTTTVGQALASSGLNTVDHRVHAHLTKNPEIAGLYVANLMYESYFALGDPLAELEEFDAFGEISVLRGGKPAYPQTDPGLIEAIARNHPGVRFVASWRDPKALSNSMVKWNNLVPRLTRNNVPGLPAGYGAEEHERIMWIEAHYNFLDAIFGGDEIYTRIDVADDDAPKVLGAHIGREIGWWGTANRNPDAHELDDADAS